VYVPFVSYVERIYATAKGAAKNIDTNRRRQDCAKTGPKTRKAN